MEKYYVGDISFVQYNYKPIKIKYSDGKIFSLQSFLIDVIDLDRILSITDVYIDDYDILCFDIIFDNNQSKQYRIKPKLKAEILSKEEFEYSRKEYICVGNWSYDKKYCSYYEFDEGKEAVRNVILKDIINVWTLYKKGETK